MSTYIGGILDVDKDERGLAGRARTYRLGCDGVLGQCRDFCDVWFVWESVVVLVPSSAPVSCFLSFPPSFDTSLSLSATSKLISSTTMSIRRSTIRFIPLSLWHRQHSPFATPQPSNVINTFANTHISWRQWLRCLRRRRRGLRPFSRRWRSRQRCGVFRAERMVGAYGCGRRMGKRSSG